MSDLTAEEVRLDRIPLYGTERQRIATAAASLFLPEELNTTTDQKRLFIGGNSLIAPVQHGDVSSQVDMLALTTAATSGVWPGDTCYRTDTSSTWICVSNNGALFTDWRNAGGGVGDMTKAVYDPANAGFFAIAQGGTGATSAGAARTALGVAIGSNVQAYSAILQAVASLANASGVLTNDGTGVLSWGTGSSSVNAASNLYFLNNYH